MSAPAHFDRESSSAVAKRMGRVIVETGCGEDGDCCICCSSLHGRTVAHLPCGHKLHSKCHLQLRESNCASRAQCPECRAPFLASLPRREQGDILMGIMRMRLDDDEIPDAESEEDPGDEEPEDEEPEDDGEEGGDGESGDDGEMEDAELEDAEMEDGYGALLRHLTRLQIAQEVDPGLWSHPDMGLGGLFEGEDGGTSDEDDGGDGASAEDDDGDDGASDEDDGGDGASAEDDDGPGAQDDGPAAQAPRLGRILVPPGTNPMVIADAIEWAVHEGLLGEDEEPSAQQLFEWLGPMNNY